MFVYSIRHITRFTYVEPVTECVMEVRLHPISDEHQNCLHFEIVTEPIGYVTNYSDYMGNTIHHFNIPGKHYALTLTAKSVVDVKMPSSIPVLLPESTWGNLDELIHNQDFSEYLLPSFYMRDSELIDSLMLELNAVRRNDPMSLVREINTKIHQIFEYVPQSTHVHSRIDEAIGQKKGVCQDFTHIMIAVLRKLGIPARYISGYLFQRPSDHERSTDGASHAWLEAFFPNLGWIGFDPTNNKLACERHIRVAQGRDYKDVPPTKGVYKGNAESKLEVSVQVAKTTIPLPEEISPQFAPPAIPVQRSLREIQFQQQQQQQ